jgi:hypothetical protein
LILLPARCAPIPLLRRTIADTELFNLARAGEFYMLTARQMGKSVDDPHGPPLTRPGIHSVIIDLTKIGTDVSVSSGIWDC